MSIAVTPVSNRSALKDFISAPRKLYDANPNWVHPLKLLQRQELSAKHNPFFQHADVKLFVARNDGEVVGRISAQIDHAHNRYHNEKTGFFGFFETVNNSIVASALTDTAASWLKQKGMGRIRGPFNFSINREAGLLVSGFDSPPQFMMPYTQPYYLELLEKAGFHKAKDLYAWRYDWTNVPVKASRSVERLREHPDVTIRVARMNKFREELRSILEIYNEAWSQNWGFVPMTEAEASKFGDDLKLIVDPDLIIIAEIKGRIAGMVVAVPNLNDAIRDLKGNLFPLGLLKLVWRIKRHTIKTARVLLMGVRKEYRTREFSGLPYLLIDECLHRVSASRYRWAELSWTLEDNHSINKLLKHTGSNHYKTYRLYEKELV